MTFLLHEDASRRTKQRWRAHEAQRCGDGCRFCRRDASQSMAKEFAVAQPIAKVDSLPTAASVLAGAVAEKYHLAAAQVAAQKAEVEVFQASLIPGMMVYHRFHQEPCILLEQMEPGVWKIHNQRGDTETHVPAAVLSPMQPNVLTRFWKGFKALLGRIFFAEREMETNGRFVTERKFRGSILVGFLLSVMASMALSFMFAHYWD